MEPSTPRVCLKRAINLEENDRIPCCFMSFTVVRNRCGGDRFAAALEELDLGFDPMMFIPAAPRGERLRHPDLRGLPLHFHPGVKTEHWISGPPDSRILNKVYHTPEGDLTTAVRLAGDWPHVNEIPFVDDFQVPRQVKPLVTSSEDVELIRKYFLLQPDDREIDDYRSEHKKASAFVDKHDMLLAGGWGVGLDMVFWLCGMQNAMVKMMDDPGFVKKLLHIIHKWNTARMQVVVSEGVDLYIRRAWYEGCDFITPDLFEEAVLPYLKAEVQLAHQYGAKFGYICSSGLIPMLDAYLESSMDVLIGVDPVQGTHTDLDTLKERIGHRICLWGGVSAAITVERGTEPEIRNAVREAVEKLGPGGFILSPIDNITIDESGVWENISIFRDEWQKCSM